MSGSTSRDAALHEAGHAVARYLFFGADFIRLDPGTMTICTELQAFEAPNPDDAGLVHARQRVEAHVIQLFCGPLAESYASDGRDRLERSPDYRRAVKMALTMSGGDRREAIAYLDWLLIRAKRLVSRPDFAGAVFAVGEALLQRGWLTFEDAASFIDGARALVDLQRIEDHPLLHPD